MLLIFKGDISSISCSSDYLSNYPIQSEPQILTEHIKAVIYTLKEKVFDKNCYSKFEYSKSLSQGVHLDVHQFGNMTNHHQKAKY